MLEAIVKLAGDHWSLPCHAESSQQMPFLTWKTADGVELSSSFSDSLRYSAPARISQEVICYGWDRMKPLQAFMLIVKGKIICV